MSNRDYDENIHDIDDDKNFHCYRKPIAIVILSIIFAIFFIVMVCVGVLCENNIVLTVGIVITLLYVIVIQIIPLLRFRNHVLRIKERINEAKSKIRIVKAKYLQVIRKTSTVNQDATTVMANAYKKGGKGSQISGAVGSISNNFTNSADIVLALAEEYEERQIALNELITEHNVVIKKFPNIIYAKILRYKIEPHIDFENLNEAYKLQDEGNI